MLERGVTDGGLGLELKKTVQSCDAMSVTQNSQVQIDYRKYSHDPPTPYATDVLLSLNFYS